MKGWNNKRAEGYIDVAVAVFVIAFLLALSVGVLSAMTMRQDLQMMSRELVDCACATGGVGEEVWTRFAELQEECGLKPTVEFTATYFDPATGSVQLGDAISCKLTLTTVLPGFGEELFPISLECSASGLSRVYWK